MEEEEGGIRLSKRFSDQGGEVDYKSKSGTAWSHNFLNQKPWHPLSYPNQRRKWIAEQQHAQHQRRVEEVSREYAQEQEFFRQSSLVSQKEKEKMEIMQAVSFMYVRPPGYNAESAKAADIADVVKTEQKNQSEGPSSSMPQESAPVQEEKKKSRPKDVFGRALPTEEEFGVLKNAPKMDTGVHGRARPFAVEVRNVKCVRCGNFGHQSGDRECPLKDAIMPSEESRLKRDDPLTAILAHTDVAEPLKWELKQKPGLSPPRGGFDPDDPNQQIVAEDIYDEYGGFLGGGDMSELLASFPSLKHKKKSKRKSKHKKQSSSSSGEDDDVDGRGTRRKEIKHKRKKKDEHSPTSRSEDLGSERHSKRSKKKYYSSDDQELADWRKRSTSRNRNKRHGHSSPTSEKLNPQKQSKRRGLKNSYSSDSDDGSDHDHHKSSTSRHRNARRHGDSSLLLYDDVKRNSRKEKKNSYPTDDKDSDPNRKKYSTSEYSNAKKQADRSPSPNGNGHRSSRRKEKKYYSSDDDSDHGHKKQSTSRNRNAGQQRDRSTSPYIVDQRKQSKNSRLSDERDSDHDHRKHSASRNRNARHSVDRSPLPCDDVGRSSRKEKRHDKRKKLKDDDSEFDPPERSEYDRWHPDRSDHKQSYPTDSGGPHQHRSQHHPQHRHRR